MEQNNTLDSMYAAYKLEFENVHTIWEKNIGFANWKLEAGNKEGLEIYIQEVYINPNVRGLKYAAALTDKCILDAEVMFDKPINKIYTTIGIGGNTIDSSIRAITEYGFKILKSNEELIYFYKELNNE